MDKKIIKVGIYEISQCSPHTFSVRLEKRDRDRDRDRDRARDMDSGDAIQYLKAISRSKILSRFKLGDGGFKFDAQRVVSFADYCGASDAYIFDYCQALRLVVSLVTLVYELEKAGFTLAFLDPDNIIVIDDSIFLYLGIDHMLPLGLDRNKVFLPRNALLNEFSAPEIIASYNTNPSVISCSAFYYSLAALISKHTIDLEGIRETSLYWFVKRNLSLDPKERNLCFV